jgi:TalC/MipB family fructose-6-phosphate aldolase
VIFLDSADIDDAKNAAHLAYVHGITTNPKLMAESGRPPLEQLRALLESFPDGPIFFQPGLVEHAVKELAEALKLGEGRVVAKLPAQVEMFALGAKLAADGVAVAYTALYSPAQALVAVDAGATWIIPYVDRAARLRPDSPVVAGIAQLLRATRAPVSVLAASIKSPEQAIGAILDGADGVTAGLDVLRELAHDPLTEQAVDEFSDAARAHLKPN